MRTLFFGLLLTAGIGCAQMHPVGPLAKVMGTPKGGPVPAETMGAKDAPTSGQAVVAAKPPQPLVTITEAEVSPEDPLTAVQKLSDELKQDQQATPAPPRTAEVSVIKGGVVR